MTTQGDAGDTSSSSRIQVVVRVRPVLPHELEHDVAVSCAQDGARVQVNLPQRSGGKQLLPGTNRAGARSFKFDACLPGSTDQEELFNTCGMQELVEAALDGYSVTIFAFGQTGSGKTHTMIGPRLSRAASGGGPTAAAAAAAAASAGTDLDRMGSADPTASSYVPPTPDPARPANSATSANIPTAGNAVVAGNVPSSAAKPAAPDPEDGILPRCVRSAFDSIRLRESDAEFTVTASCLELYNEAVTDLLGQDKSKQLQVRKDERDGFQVSGLSLLPCSSANHALRHMQRALQLRHTRSHRLNDYSSRSHCLMTFVFASQEKAADGRLRGAQGGLRRYGKLVLVDLAGSERLKETGNTDRDAVRETGFINKSLFTLGQVLSGLCARSSAAAGPAFIPYRDSKLTQLLWDGLRGTGRALMLACLGPTSPYADESLNTLHFASMAQRIKASPVMLLDPQDQLVVDLRNTIRQLQEENRQLAHAMQQLAAGSDAGTILDALPESLRSAALGPGTPPVTAPAGMSGHGPAAAAAREASSGCSSPLLLLRKQGAGRAGSSSSSTAAAASPWRSSHDAAASRPPRSANVLRLQPLSPTPSPKAQAAAAAGSSRSRLSFDAATAAAAAASPTQLRSQNSADSPLHPATRGSGNGSRRAASQPRGTGGGISDASFPAAVAAASSLHAGSGGHHQSSVPAASRSSNWGSAQHAAAAAAAASSQLHGAGGRSPAGRQLRAGGPTALPATGGQRGYANPQLSRSFVARTKPASGQLPAADGSSSTADAMQLLTQPPLLLFPELAALEEEFQQSLAVAPTEITATASITDGVGFKAAVRQPTSRNNAAAVNAVAHGAGSAPAGAGAGVTEGVTVGVTNCPEVAALKWAARNKWFGTDVEMTAYAYQAHDQLVDTERLDPSSELYYLLLEQKVAARFPDRWATHLREQNFVKTVDHEKIRSSLSQKLAPSANHVNGQHPGLLHSSEERREEFKLPPSASLSTAAAFSRALRISVKAPLPASSSHVPPHVHGFANINAAKDSSASYQSASGSYLSASSIGRMPEMRDGSAVYLRKDSSADAVWRMQHQSTTTDAVHGYAGTTRNGTGPTGTRVNAIRSSQQLKSQQQHVGHDEQQSTQSPPASHSEGHDVNPFNLQALNPHDPASSTPQHAHHHHPHHSHHQQQRGAHGHQGKQGAPGSLSSSSTASAAASRQLPGASEFSSYEAMQAEYLRQRALLIDELRGAKEQAEADRARIMARIGKALGTSRWRR